MITDKEKARQTLKKILLAVEPFSDEPALALFYEALSESAEQARKEAADRVVDYCWDLFDDSGIEKLRNVILNSPVKEGKTDAEKLAVVERALKDISKQLSDGMSRECWIEAYRISDRALNEIQS